MKASLVIYSTPKYKASDVRMETKTVNSNDKVSQQKLKCESIRSKQKNHLPKSIK
jgi:hypothetical protein